MYAIYRTNINDLDSRFVRALKTMFKNKEVEIAICDVSEVEEDETAYLLKSPANRERLLRALDNVNHDRNLVTVNLDELE